MLSTDRGKGKGQNKISHIFKKNGKNHGTPPPMAFYTTHNRSSSVHISQMEDDNIWRLKQPAPSTTTGVSAPSKKFVFNDEDSEDDIEEFLDDLPNMSPNLKDNNRSSVILEGNPLASTPDVASHRSAVSALSWVDFNNIIEEIDLETEKININIQHSDTDEDESSSYSITYDVIRDGDDTALYPPGYSAATKSRKSRKSRNSCIDNDDKYKRRKSNRKDIWRRMMTSIVDGVGSLGANALQMLSEFELEDEDDILSGDEDIKYNGYGLNPRKYISVTKNTSLFRHNGYTITRRLSSNEVLRSRYTAKCYRRKYRPRSKSDPSLLPFTKRFDRKLELEYRPGTMNIFMMNAETKKSTYRPQYPTRAHDDSVYFRYVFDDSDFDDDSIDDSSDDQLDSIFKAYNIEIAEPMDTIESKNDNNGYNDISNLSVPHHKPSNRLTWGSFNSLKSIKDYSSSLPKSLGLSMKRIQSMSSSNLKPTVPYGGHVEASESMIESEFGSTAQHISVFLVKKRNKLGRDIDRMAVLDIPLQVLRIKDVKDKTHKEHIVSSISGHTLIGSARTGAQIIIKFYDNRDYFLTFRSHNKCIEFRNLIEKLRIFNSKMVNNRSKERGIMNHGMGYNRDDRSQTVIIGSNSTGNLHNHHTNVNNNYGFYDDDDEVSMSTRTYTNVLNYSNKAGNLHRNRERFDTEMFDDLDDDGNVYTGMETANVVYRIVKINKWGTKKERTMIVHKGDRIVRLFDDKRRCHSEYPLKIMATLDIMDSLNVEVVFLIDQKPTQFVFRSHIDMWDFVEQIRSIAHEIMVNDRRLGKNKKKATMLPPTNDAMSRKRPRSRQNSMDYDDIVEFDADFDINPNVLRYSVLRLIRSQARAMNQQVTWRQHRRCIYLDLEKRTVRMLTLGMHIKDYGFEDVLLLEKSYINVNQLHISCKHKEKIKEYWYEFISPQARAEFVGRLLRALPGTKQIQSTITSNPLYTPNKENNEYADSYNPDIVIQHNLSPRPPNTKSGKSIRKKPRRKRLSSETLRCLMVEDIDTPMNGAFSSSFQSVESGGGALSSDDEGKVGNKPPPLLLGNESENQNGNKAIAFTEDPLSIIVGSWNVSESEINFANLKMWIPPSRIEPHDIYVIGLQECASSLRKEWVSGILRHIDCGRKQYLLLNKAFLMGIGIIIIVHRCHITKISHLHAQVVPTGKGNIIGNKGATAISFQFQETSFAFINAHLAARAEKFEKRAKNFSRIIKNLELGRPGLDVLHQFTHTFFLGDLNYRIEKDFYETVEMVKKKKWSKLVECDQLRVQMAKNHVFYGFKEGGINFCPTYRWERNKNTISNKREQPPSYCDRILYRSLPQTYDLWQECYLSSHRCFGSDHRPVWSIFKFKPKMPYFTSQSHDIRILNDDDDLKNQKNNEYTNITISLVELQASFKGALNNKNNKKIQIHLDDTIDIILHYNYSAKPIRLKGGTYDESSRCWRWPLEVLDALRIKPFIPDAHFICRTHIFVCFINVSKGNMCIGYSIISLFNAFPKSLIDTNKLMKEFKSIAKQMSLMPSPYNPDDSANKNTAFGNKQFDIPILLYGNPLGNLTGFVYADGKIVEKHRKITNLDLLSAHKHHRPRKQQSTRNIHRLPTSTTSLFKRASARFINVKKF